MGSGVLLERVSYNGVNLAKVYHTPLYTSSLPNRAPNLGQRGYKILRREQRTYQADRERHAWDSWSPP